MPNRPARARVVSMLLTLVVVCLAGTFGEPEPALHARAPAVSSARDAEPAATRDVLNTYCVA